MAELVNYLQSLTTYESQLLINLIDPSGEADLVFPKNPNLDEFWDQLTICLKVLSASERTSSRLKPVIGKYLLWAKAHPEAYKQHGYRNYSEFISEYVVVKMNISRSALYDCRTVAEKLPDLLPQEYEELGPTKANLLARFCQSDDPSYPKYLNEAKTRTVVGLRLFAEEQNLIERGEVNPIVIVIQANEKVHQMWMDFIALPEVHATVGSSSPATILEHLIMEGYEWTVSAPQEVMSLEGNQFNGNG